MRAAAVVLAAALAPALVRAQAVTVGVGREPGATVLGRVCVDVDGDSRCGPGDPGVAGARVVAEGGEVALAGSDGRFHMFEVPARTVLRDRAAYGGHTVAAAGLGVKRSFEVGPAGAAEIHLAVPPPPGSSPPPLVPDPRATPPPEAGPDGAIRFGLAARTGPGASVASGDERVTAGEDGSFAIRATLSPGENRVVLAVVSRDGATAIWVWRVHLASRSRGGTLVIPAPPERAVAFGMAPAPGGGALVTGELPAGLRVRVAGALAAAGPRFAAYAPPGARATVEVVDERGDSVARAEIPVRPSGPLAGTAALAEIEVSVGGGGALVFARGAASGRGMLGPFEYEAGVDLDDRDRRRLADLARPRDALAVEHALDPARTFGASGDHGAAGDRNPGRGRVWGRVEGAGARLDVGTARAGLTGAELGRYDRALSGAKVTATRELGPVSVEASAFGATLRADSSGNAPPRAAHDVLDATGGAVFWLAHGEVVPGSEAMRIEWRDPFTGRLTDQRALVRGEDYEIEWTSGRLTLAAPLRSVSSPASVRTGDPFAAPEAVVIADYLFAAGGTAREDLSGGRLGAAIGPLALALHGASEERPGDPYRLVAGSATVDLGPLLRVRAEAARSEGALLARGGTDAFARSADGGFAFSGAGGGERGDALHLEARGEEGPVSAVAWWREREAGYSDAEFQEARRARERGADVALGIRSVTASLRYAERSGSDPRDPAGAAPIDERQLLLRAGWQRDRLGIVAEALHLAYDAPASAEETSAGLRASYALDPALTVDVSHHQGLAVSGAGRDPTFTAAGATFGHRAAALSVRGGWGPDVGPRLLVSGQRSAAGEAVYGTFTADPDAPGVLGERASALGARRSAGGAEVFTEEQFARDAFGLRQARVLGAALRPARGVRLSLSAERGSRLRLDGSEAARTAAAAAVGAALGPLRLAARGEGRREGADDQVAAGGSVEWLPAAGTQVALRTSWMRGWGAGREALAFEAAISGALRRDRWSALASVARLVDERPGLARRDGVVARLAGTAGPASRVELGVGGAVAVQEVDGGRADRLTGSARARVLLSGPFDGAVEYARRAPLRGGGIGALDAVRAEAGVAARDCRIAVGYNLVGFSGDGLSPAADTSRLYVRAQLAY